MKNYKKINIRDIHNTLWRCRDFELTNLWQRSIFLTAFIVLFFTAYGSILMKLFDENTDLISILLNIIAYIISLVGIIFSVLWIKMGKGSKAWYERYESAISAFEKNEKYATKEASEIGGFSYESIDGYKKPTNKYNNSIFSNGAGAYSVSRINIAIGQVFLILWFLIGFIHLILSSIILSCITNICCLGVITSCFLILIMILVTCFISNSKQFKSTALE